LIYVIDSFDLENLEESKSEFHKLITNAELKNTIILIYANKQDISKAKSVADLIQIYGFDQIKSHQWHIQQCSAKTGEGLMNGLQWLSDQLVYKKNTRFPNNPYIAGKVIFT
jgi:signal recognition particle receptor subunit beta